MKTKSRSTNLEAIRAKNTEGSKVCPVCGKEALIRYLDCVRKVWIYKHTKLVKYAEGGKGTVTVYHEANR